MGGPGGNRHPFPDPLAGVGSESRPLFDAAEIAEWLDLPPVPDAEPDADGRLETNGDRFRRAMRLHGLVTLKHRLGSAETMISRALAVIAMSAEGQGWITEAARRPGWPSPRRPTTSRRTAGSLFPSHARGQEPRTRRRPPPEPTRTD